MTLSSVIFIFGFAPLLVLLYYTVPYVTGKYAASSRKIILLLASLFFFAWLSQEHLPFLLLVVVANWAIALGIGKVETKRAGK
ncbi:MAG: hypothetical protein RR772_08175, partial [Gordonibacter sp.]